MQLRELVSALRNAWWLPVVGLVVGGLVAVAVSYFTVPTYESETTLFVSTTDSTSSSEALQGGQFSQERVASYARLLTTDQLLGRVIDELHLQRTPQDLADDVTATAVPDTVLLQVTVTDTSPQGAHTIAAAIGGVFAGMVTELETTDRAPSPVKVTVVDAADLPDRPSTPKWALNVAVGLLGGLLIGAGVAIARAKLDRTVRDPEEAAALAGAPVIATILRDDSLSKAHVFTRTGSSRSGEDYRQLRTNLQFLNVDEPPKVIMVSSAVPSEGKTTVTINLAVALAEAGRRVTVVEADLRRPLVAQYLGLVGDVGITNVLAGTADLDDVVQPFGNSGMTVIASGPTPPNPGELLASSHMRAFLDKLRGDNDFVLVDAPPLLPVADASGLAAFTDGVLLSLRYGSTRKDQLRDAAEVLGRVHAKVLGIVLNIVPARNGRGDYGYGYRYGHAYGKTPESVASRRERT